MTEGESSVSPPEQGASTLFLLAGVVYLLGQPWGMVGIREAHPALFHLTLAGWKLVAVVLGFYCASRFVPGDPLGLRRRPTWLSVKPVFGAYFVALPLLVVLSMKFKADQAQTIVADLISGDGTFRAAVFFMAVVVTPFFEELVFRGLLQGGLRRYLPPTGAVVVSSLLFALVHPAAVLVPILLLALLLGWAFERTKSLWVPIGVHFLHNGVAFALVLWGAGG